MPLTLCRYRNRALASGLELLLISGVLIYLICTEEAVPVVVFGLFMLLLSGFLLHSLCRFVTLRRAFADALPLRGTVVRREHGFWAGSARIIIAYDGQEYASPTIFLSGEVSDFVGNDVEFAFGRDGYLFVFRVL